MDELGAWILRVVRGETPPGWPEGAEGSIIRHGLVGLAVRHPLASPRIRSLYGALAGRQRLMDQAMTEIVEALQLAGVPATVVKGPQLDRTVYREPGLRTYGDVDLLVPRARIDDVMEILRTHPRTFAVPDKWPRADKRDVLIRGAGGYVFNLDVHWDLFSYHQLRGVARDATAPVWEGDETIDLGFGPLAKIPDEVTAAFLSTHAILDHRFRLILFRDLAEFAAGEPDWSTIVRFAREHGLASFVYLALHIARDVAGAAVPDAVLEALRPRHLVLSWVERSLRRADLVTFDGHRVHPLNLGVVLLHDRFRDRVALAMRAPVSFSRWRRHVAEEERRREAKRVLVVTTTNRRRGAEVFGEQLVSRLPAHGWEAELIALFGAGNGPTTAASPLAGGSVSAHGYLDPGVVRALRREIVRRRPAVVFANGSATLKYTAAALIGLRPRPAFVYGSIGDPSYWARGWARRRLTEMWLRRADVVTSVSATTAARLPDVGRPVVVAPTGIDLAAWAVVDRSAREGPVRILVVGSLTHEKGPDIALSAITAAADRISVVARFVGDGDLRPLLERRAIPGVEFTGTVADVRPQYAWADVLLIASRTEGLPGVAIEAAATGLPVIARDVGGIREVVEDGVTGWIVDGGADALARRLVESAEDRPALIRAGSEARALVEQRFGLDGAVAGYAAAFEKARLARER